MGTPEGPSNRHTLSWLNRALCKRGLRFSGACESAGAPSTCCIKNGHPACSRSCQALPCICHKAAVSPMRVLQLE